MKYMLLHCVDKDVDISAEATAELNRAMMAWLEDTIPRGVSLHGGQLQPAETASTVRVRRGELMVTDGPFAETKEQIAGYDVIECADLDEALELVSRLPLRYGCIEVRPFVDGDQALPRRSLEVAGWARAIGWRDDRLQRGEPPSDVTTAEPAGKTGNKYMLMICVAEGVELSPEEVVESDRRMAAWLEDTIGRGVNLHGGRLRPVRSATTVRARKGELMVTDGPFAETKEQIAGYDVIECPHLDQAIEVASRHPVARFGCIEVRPFVDSEQAMPRRPLEVAGWARTMAPEGEGQGS